MPRTTSNRRDKVWSLKYTLENESTVTDASVSDSHNVVHFTVDTHTLYTEVLDTLVRNDAQLSSSRKDGYDWMAAV